jgi:hypothetical protein
LAKRVLLTLLPKVLAYEEKEVQSASAAYYTTATVTQRTTFGIFIVSSIVSGLRRWPSRAASRAGWQR